MRSLTDRKTAPPSVQPIAGSILSDRSLMGAEGRARLRRVFGKEPETFHGSIPGMRFMPKWVFVLDGETVRLATPQDDALPRVIMMGPFHKAFYTTLCAPEETPEEAALKIVQFIRQELDK